MLETLLLSNNELTGSVPSEVGNIHKLKEFVIGEFVLSNINTYSDIHITNILYKVLIMNDYLWFINL